MTDPLPLEQHARLLRIIAEGIVRPSFARCCEQGPEIFDTFYASLADHVPGVGPMFANTDMQKQNALIRAPAGIDVRPAGRRLGALHAT